MVMVTMEDRVTRLEAAQEFNAQQSAEILSRVNLVVSMVEESRKEAREMNDAARKEAREMNDAARKEAREIVDAARKEAREIVVTARNEAREANEIARRETREMVDAARRDARHLFIAGFTVASGLGGGIIFLLLRMLEQMSG